MRAFRPPARPAEVEVDLPLDDEDDGDEPAAPLGQRAQRAARADEYVTSDRVTYTDAYLALMDEFGISESTAKRDLSQAQARTLRPTG